MMMALMLSPKCRMMITAYGILRMTLTISGVGSCIISFVFLFMFHCITEHGLDTPEAVTLAQQLVNRQTTKTQLINDGFNRYSLNSKEGLPSWFLDDESKFYKPNLPITKEAVAALREKQRALDARPIKKVAEAKARKKFKAQQRLEKAMKKAEGVNATSDMSEREKAQQIEKLMRKGTSSGTKMKKDIKVVVAKGIHKGVKGRPKGVKGRYTMVDARMRKEVRSYTKLRIGLPLICSVASIQKA
jgi:AdoMet-dependent rRNA methyltransferase SPB1